MQPADSNPRATVAAYRQRMRATHARLHRVNAALTQWAEHEAAAAMPADLRPADKPPTLGRAALKELQALVGSELVLLDEAWHERN